MQLRHGPRRVEDLDRIPGIGAIRFKEQFPGKEPENHPVKPPSMRAGNRGGDRD